MAIDIALGTGGQRSSRSRRAGGASIDTGSTTVQSRDVAREVDVGGQRAANGLSAIGDAISSFFPVLQQAQQQDEAQEMLNDRRANRDEIARIESEVRLNKDGAREAISTGDFSSFIPDDEMARRRVISDSFQTVAAQTMAFDDYDARLEQAIKETPLDGSPEATVDDFLKAELKGANPLFVNSYSRVIHQRSARAIQDYKASRLELQQAQAERQASNLINSEITTQIVPPTAEGIVALRRKVIGSLPMNAPEAIQRADALVDSSIISLAAQGDLTAIRMASIPDPARDGTSVLSRNPGKMNEAIQAAITKDTQVRSMQAHNELENIEDRAAGIKAGSSEENYEDLWVDLWLHRERHGDSGRFDTLRDKIATALDAKGTEVGTYDRIAQGLMPTVSNSEWNDIAESLWDGSAVARMVASGLTPEAAENRSIDMLARRGSGTKVRDSNSAVLTGSSDSEEVGTTFTQLMALDRASDRPMEGMHLSSDAVPLYHLMLHANNSGQDPAAVREKFLEALNDGQGGNPLTHFERRLSDPGNDKGETFGRGGSSKVAEDVWKGIDAEELEIAGLIFDKKPGYSSLSPVAQDRIQRAVNMASFMLQNTAATTGQIQELASSMVAGEFGIELDIDGNEVVTLDQTPPVAVYQTGAPIPGARFDRDAASRASIVLGEASEGPSAAVIAAIGGHGGVAQDSLTRAGFGLSVRSGASGFPQDVNMVPGSVRILPLSGLPEGFKTSFFETIAEDEAADAVTIRIPPVPADGDDPRKFITDELFMLYDRRAGGWTLRYADSGTPKRSLEDLSESNVATTARQRELESNFPVPGQGDGVSPFGAGGVPGLLDQGTLDPRLASGRTFEDVLSDFAL